MPETKGKSCWAPEDVCCPRCNCQMITNGRLVWCSFTKCRFGLDEDVTLESLRDQPKED